MPYYLYQVAYSVDAAKTMVSRPQDREKVARKAVESLGGKLHAFFFAFGPYDLVLIAEMPDNVSAGAISLAVGSSGSFSKFHTTPLMSTAESIEMMKKAKKISYAAPK
jgi:uncharacterized protein with GYD domain